MPSMADITVKANDGTTNVVYNTVTGSPGIGAPAVWRNNASVNRIAFKPIVSLNAKKRNGNRQSFELLYVWPIQAVDGDTVKQVGQHTKRTIYTIDTTDAQAGIDEFVSQGGNLEVATLIRSALKELTAPR